MTAHPAPAPAHAGRLSRIPHVLYGGDYSPEQWPEEVWLQDARLMQQAGVNLVSLGIFAWSSLETSPGRFDFGWLDRVIALLDDHGVAVNLATPTASPPPWLIRTHPEVLPVTANGVTLWHGSRRHYCPHAPAYRDAALRIAHALAERYRDHPALAMWHVDNEYACHIGECFCDRSAQAFRAWLLERHGNLAGLNEAWGTAFWSQRYGHIEEVQPPRAAPTFKNPSQVLDWHRFCSDSWLECFRDQAAVLREATPDVPITTNFMGFHPPVDYWRWAGEEDLVSNDAYPDTGDPDWRVDAAMACDLMRSLGGGRPWLLMEQAPAHVSWRERNVTKAPGVMRLASFQAIARAADGVMFFQWRASRAGAEQHHSAMVPHAGTSTRTWREVAALGEELRRCDEVLGSRVPTDVAFLFDWQNLWALASTTKPSSDVQVLPQLRAFYGALHEAGRSVDFVHPERDISAYRLLIGPSLYLMTERAAQNLRRYVESGGVLVLTYFSGIVDEYGHVRLGGYPAQLTDVLGLTVEEIAPLPAGRRREVLTDDGEVFGSTIWADVIRPDGATAIARFSDATYPDGPAVTEHRFGRGAALYVGTVPDRAGTRWLVRRAVKAAGLADPPMLPTCIEAVRRTSGDGSWLFVLNHGSEAVEVALQRRGVDVLTGTAWKGAVTVGATDLVILREER